MKILITGSTGQLGRELVPRLLKRGDRLTLLVRDTDKAAKLFPGCELIKGDVTSEGFGISRPPRPDAVYHLAADIDLGSAHESRVWAVNFDGTVNAVNFCLRNSVPGLFYAGTAYTGKDRNIYERSKKAAEEFVEASDIGSKTIFKLGILVPGAGEAGSASAGALYQFVNAIARVLDHAGERERALRIKGLPEARLNLVHADQAAEFMAGAAKPGKFWLTHPDPVRLSELAEWVGEVLGARIKFEPEFKMSAAEALFHRGVRPFLPYLRGDDFPSHLEALPRVSAEFIRESVAAAAERAGFGKVRGSNRPVEIV